MSRQFGRTVHQFNFVVTRSSSKAAEVIEMVRNIHSPPSTVCLIVACVFVISSIAFCIFTKVNPYVRCEASGATKLTES